MDDRILFSVATPPKFTVRSTRKYWEYIVTVNMRGRESEVKSVLRQPDQVRRSRRDPSVYLFYQRQDVRHWLCVVVKRLNDDGFVITTYPSSTVKEGELLWTKYRSTTIARETR